MPKHINIIARSNGVGLDSDVRLIKEVLESAGYLVTFSHCRARSLCKKWFGKKHEFDANIFLERVFPRWLNAAKKNVLIPNQERFPKRHISRLKNIDLVLCKSRHSEEIFSKLGASTEYTSFTSKDIQQNNVSPDYEQFFHLAGRSTLKGTDTLLNLWEQHSEWPVLTIIQHEDNAPESTPPNVNLIAKYLPYEELITIANQHGIHLCPSLSEGWGHYIVEAMSCKAVVLTTDAPPMNELINDDRGILCSYSSSEPRHLGTNFQVDINALQTQVERIITMTTDEKSTIGNNARNWYLKNQTLFSKKLLQTLHKIL